MGDKLKPVNGPKTDAFNLLVRYMQDPGGSIELTSDAEKMLKRLMYADAKMKTRKFTEQEVTDDMMTTFAISEFTAIRDIKNTQKLFAAARSINKQYLAHLHLERINQDIEDARERLFWYEDDAMPGIKKSRVPDAKELAALAKLHHAYSFTLNTAPEEKGKDILPPPVFNFILVKGATIDSGMSVQDALSFADQYLQGSTTPQDDQTDDLDDDQWESIKDDPDDTGD